MKIARSRPMGWAPILVEVAPLAAFSYSGRFGLEIADRFYLGAGLAILGAGFLATRRWSFNPLFAAANIWLCLEAFALGSGIASLVRLSARLQEAAFFATLLGVGSAFLVFSASGLFARGGHDARRARHGSLLLLGLIAASLLWSLFWRGNELVAAIIPATVIFLVQQLWPLGERA